MKSMSAKLLGTAVMLVVLAVIITVAAVYSINRLTTQITNLGYVSNRATALGQVNAVLLERGSLVKDTILSSNDAANARSIEEMNSLNAAMASAMKLYSDNLPSWASDLAKGTPAAVSKLWNEYIAVTEEVARLGSLNTNAKAAEEAEKLEAFLDGIDADLEKLALTLRENPDVAIQENAGRVRNNRVQITLFRNNVNRFAGATDDARIQDLKNRIISIVGTVDKELQDMAASLPQPYSGMMDDIYKRLTSTSSVAFATMVPLVETNSATKALDVYTSQAMPKYREVVELVDNRMGTITELQTNTIIDATSLGRTITITMIVVSVIAILGGLAVSRIVISAVTRRLRGIIDSLNESSSQVGAAAAQISDSSQNLAEGSTEQAASLEQTSSALEQMASMTRQNADNANETNETTQNNNKQIEAGATSVRNMSEAMAEIDNSAEQISRIIKTIQDIAFQTNLLALNAAVEAARAGEAGKGFAVVADEVRNLAGRSAQAAKDTTQLIETTIDRVKRGSAIAAELDAGFKEIEEGSNSVARLITEISSATNEQAQGVDQVNTAVAQMDKVTQSNAATAEQAASAAEELSAQASALKGMVEDLVNMVEGKSGSATKATLPPPKRVMQVRQIQSEDYARPPRATPTSASTSNSGGGVKMLPASEVIPLGEDDEF